jgi:hypothetical protein
LLHHHPTIAACQRSLPTSFSRLKDSTTRDAARCWFVSSFRYSTYIDCAQSLDLSS